MKDTYPNLFIVGAAKSGTSTLNSALSEHPDIYMSSVKEPNYFGGDLLFRQPRISRKDYIGLFESCNNFKYRGEASVLYLYSSSAPIEIRKFCPKPRIIIMLRDPVDLVYSGFWQNRKTGFEPVRRFDRALRLESSRRAGRNIPRHARILNGLFYSDLARAPEAARHFESVFGSQSVFVGDLEDLKRDPHGFYLRLFRFLELPAIFPYTVIKNKGSRRRSTLLAGLAKGDAPFLVRLGRALVPREMGRPLLNFVRRLDRRYNHRPGYPPMRPQTREWLEKEYASQRRAYRAICTEHRRRWGAEARENSCSGA